MLRQRPLIRYGPTGHVQATERGQLPSQSSAVARLSKISVSRPSSLLSNAIPFDSFVDDNCPLRDAVLCCEFGTCLQFLEHPGTQRVVGFEYRRLVCRGWLADGFGNRLVDAPASLLVSLQARWQLASRRLGLPLEPDGKPAGRLDIESGPSSARLDTEDRNLWAWPNRPRPSLNPLRRFVRTRRWPGPATSPPSVSPIPDPTRTRTLVSRGT